MIKSLVCLVSFFISTCVGIYSSKRLKDRRVLFFDFVNFCNAYEANLEFFQKEIKEFIVEFCRNSGDEFNRIIKEKTLIDLPIKKVNYFLGKIQSTISVINIEQDRYIDNFLELLGKSDVVSQKTQLASYRYYFSKQLENATKEWETKGKMYSKLGVLGGIFLCILMV